MSNSYIAYHFKITPAEPASEILIAELGELDFESFTQNDDGVTAYIQKQFWNNSILDDVYILNSSEFTITYTFEEIAPTNWNKEWEKNFNPLQIDDLVSIRAPFHPKVNTKYDIVIEPKMSFGTGHHETTFMMIQLLLNINLDDKIVLDMGCGTGILAIFASLKNAKHVDAIDYDEWCYKNTLENIETNNCTNIDVFLGDANLLQQQQYDVIIANINRNILLNDMDAYKKVLKPDGIILFSGFYDVDLEIIQQKAKSLGLTFVRNIEKNKWIAAVFKSE